MGIFEWIKKPSAPTGSERPGERSEIPGEREPGLQTPEIVPQKEQPNPVVVDGAYRELGDEEDDLAEIQRQGEIDGIIQRRDHPQTRQ